ncbi:MAG: serine hydrolase, partial [Bacteroidota bacterium]
HQAGFKPFLSFYQATMANNVLSKKYYSDHKSDTFPNRVAEKIFIRKDYPDSIIHIILDTPLKTPKHYEYSDLGFILLSRIVKKISGEPLDQYVRSRFYLPMGMGNTGYKPREWYPMNKIAPTEDDKLFRRQVVQGDVHDPAAAMLGGVSGHAGLFSNTTDIAKLLQMFLQKGEYGGVRYLSEKTIDEFTRCQFCESNNRRGLGFDKPSVGGGGPVCDEASANSYGHSGFTGTYFWVDPQHDLIYIFLSNRVHTDSENKKITSMSIRSKIHSVIYKSIQK